MKLRNQALKYGQKFAVVAVPVVLLANGAFAAGTDFSAITSGVDTSTVVIGIVAMGAIMILPNVARWAAKKLATFF